MWTAAYNGINTFLISSHFYKNLRNGSGDIFTWIQLEIASC